MKSILKIKKIVTSKEFIRFVIGGVSAFFLDLLLLNFFFYTLEIKSQVFDKFYLANIFSTVIAILYNFTLQKFWAFKEKSGKYRNQLIKFFFVQFINLIIFNGFLFGALADSGINISVSKIIVTTIQGVFSYVMYKWFVFKK